MSSLVVLLGPGFGVCETILTLEGAGAAGDGLVLDGGVGASAGTFGLVGFED